MPSVTREQVNKWNAKLQNGFRFDIQRYVVWGEKQIKKSKVEEIERKRREAFEKEREAFEKEMEKA